MTEKRIVFDEFEIPRVNGLEYLFNEELQSADYLFVNELGDRFSMYFEKGFPVFTIPQQSDRGYCLFELKRQDRVIKFFCPEKQKNFHCAVWYFYVELLDDEGKKHNLPGQVRVLVDEVNGCSPKRKPKFIEVLEKVRLRAGNPATMNA